VQKVKPNIEPNGNGKREDRRVTRTRERLNWSMVELIQEQGYDQTTVQDVADRADVSRSTFYTHFEDKDDLFIQHFVGFIKSLGKSIEWDVAPGAHSSTVRDFFAHVAGMRPLYTELRKAKRLDQLLKMGQIILAETLDKRIAACNPPQEALPAPIVAQHIAVTLFTLLTWWMDHHHPVDAEELAQMFHRLVRGL
jgi:AcrR family transcriptional regulator